MALRKKGTIKLIPSNKVKENQPVVLMKRPAATKTSTNCRYDNKTRQINTASNNIHLDEKTFELDQCDGLHTHNQHLISLYGQ